MKKQFDTISDDVKKRCVAEVAARVEEVSGEPVGVIAAQDIIDIVTLYYGPEIYKAAIEDTKKIVRERLSDVEYEIDGLTQ